MLAQELWWIAHSSACWYWGRGLKAKCSYCWTWKKDPSNSKYPLQTECMILERFYLRTYVYGSKTSLCTYLYSPFIVTVRVNAKQILESQQLSTISMKSMSRFKHLLSVTQVETKMCTQVATLQHKHLLYSVYDFTLWTFTTIVGKEEGLEENNKQLKFFCELWSKSNLEFVWIKRGINMFLYKHCLTIT